MLALIALVLFLAAAVISGIQRGWVLTLVCLGLAAWLWETGAGILP
jgi:hypothetical protein